MAEVHLAEWHPAGGSPKRVALKRLYPHIAENPELDHSHKYADA